MDIEITHLQIRKVNPKTLDTTITFKYTIDAYNMSGCIDRIIPQPFTTELLIELVQKHLKKTIHEPQTT